MTVKIELSEERAAVLKAKAAAQGLTLESWLQRLASQDTAMANPEIPERFLKGECQPGRPTGMGFVEIHRSELAGAIKMDSGALGRVMSGERQLTVCMMRRLPRHLAGRRKGGRSIAC